MARKIRLIKTTFYIKHNDFNELENTDFSELQNELRDFFSKRGNGKDCLSIVRVLPTLASSNTADVELVAFTEDIDFINETNAADGIADIINQYLDIDISHVLIKQSVDPFVAMGDFN